MRRPRVKDELNHIIDLVADKELKQIDAEEPAE